MAGDDVVDLDLEARRRMPSLTLDLDRLGIALPPPVAFPLTSVAGALGALYVSEGSLLGGRVVAPHIRAVLGADTPVAFFEAPGIDISTRWASCRRVIDRSLVATADRDVAAATAVAVFERFCEVLCR
jgi:heme oxygenase